VVVATSPPLCTSVAHQLAVRRRRRGLDSGAAAAAQSAMPSIADRCCTDPRQPLHWRHRADATLCSTRGFHRLGETWPCPTLTSGGRHRRREARWIARSCAVIGELELETVRGISCCASSRKTRLATACRCKPGSRAHFPRNGTDLRARPVTKRRPRMHYARSSVVSEALAVQGRGDDLSRITRGHKFKVRGFRLFPSGSLPQRDPHPIGGTEGSNPAPSSGESANHRFRRGGGGLLTSRSPRGRQARPASGRDLQRHRGTPVSADHELIVLPVFGDNAARGATQPAQLRRRRSVRRTSAAVSLLSPPPLEDLSRGTEFSRLPAGGRVSTRRVGRFRPCGSGSQSRLTA
jgi:hypothetical protein